MKIAFAGMGIMGSNMALNLLKKNYDVMVWNRSLNDNVRRVKNNGGKFVEKIESLASADYIFMCLSDEKSVESFTSKLTNVNNKIVIDFTTIGTKSAKTVQETLRKKGCDFLDAPISGGDTGAINGSLSIMVGGSKDKFNELLPVFNVLGSKVAYCGEVGSGQAIKLINQLLCAMNLLAVKEAFDIAKDFGVDPHLVVDICSAGAGGSWQLENLGSKALQNDFAPGFKIEHLSKDLRLLSENTTSKLPSGIKFMIESMRNDLDQKIINKDEGTQAFLRAMLDF